MSDPIQRPTGPDPLVSRLPHLDHFKASTLLRLALKHAVLLIACWAAVFATGLFWTLGQTKTYRAEATLRLDPDPPRPLGTKVEMVGSGNSSYWNRREFYETELRTMRSRRVATAVVRALGLQGDADFLAVKPVDRPKFKPWTVDDAANVLLARVSVEWVKDSSLAVLRYEDTDPKRCTRVLNALVRTYLAQNLEGASVLSSNALEWLNGQLEHLRTDLEKSEQALTDFRQKNNVLSLSLEDRHNLIAGELEQISKEMTSLEIKRIALAARNAEVSKLQPTDALDVGASEFLASSVLSSLRQIYAQQLRDYHELLATLDENHPKVLAAKAKLDSISKSVTAEVNNIKRAVAGDLKAVERQIGDVKKREQEVQTKAHELQGFETPYNQLVRTKTNNEKIYGLVLERARETDLTRVMNFNNIRVLDDAIDPQHPFRPNVPLSLAVSAALGLIVGLALVFVREISDRSLKTPGDVEETVGLPCIGLIPEIERNRRDTSRRRKDGTLAVPPHRDLIVASDPDGGVAEAARAIRTNLMFMSPDRPKRRILVTSAAPEEGKTTFACSLAIVLAQSGLKVLLVDTDLRRPRLHRTFGVPNDTGVTMGFSGAATISECVQETAIENLSILPSGPIPPNPAEILHSERFRNFIEELHKQYDRIVFDSPPILPVTDAGILSQSVDGVVVVTRGFRTQKTALRQAVRQLLDIRAPVAGVVLNAIDLSRSDYREYHYYYRRDGYYTSRTDDEAA